MEPPGPEGCLERRVRGVDCRTRSQGRRINVEQDNAWDAWEGEDWMVEQETCRRCMYGANVSQGRCRDGTVVRGDWITAKARGG